ncbi:hypothetical protein ANCDUO_24240 [Ancylostoma duodenale]|uniref:Uncharacterized protein n=1 Tax=Ancylostoma duodenale TaxID=51022 RepID=A0A0C2FLH2_9BILA|nr:hypothetical protein ANCDUO_24240 [Ancylostoma duodenale]
MVLFDKVPLAHYIANIWQRDVNWEKHNPKYRCLFGQVHVVNAAKALLLLEILVIPIYVLFLFPINYMSGPHVLIILLTLYALKKEKQRWLWPIILYAVGSLTQAPAFSSSL